jgi:UDP-N-acetylglucosamine--N-acetylmuramyl-(pentapeptide) pyrophosphoryl-undecaprenol N-acetylglucosamine transferase
MLAAALGGIPTVAFEPNVVPGFANRVLAIAVSAAAVQFEETCAYFRRCAVVGVPVRRAFFEIAPKASGFPTMLVSGGSQGAHALNAAVMGALGGLQQRIPELHVIHQTGERDYNEAQGIYLRSGISAEVTPFIERMPEAFARADLLVCRSGASTVGEVAAAGKPAIFVPFPHAADDHQLRNAEVLARAGAAMVIEEKDLTSNRLTEVVAGLLVDPAKRAHMAAAAKSLAHHDAAGEVARMAAKLAGVAED